jgi:acyl-CoA reductase-like NAD-dependent aldehyde dehydrogenase
MQTRARVAWMTAGADLTRTARATSAPRATRLLIAGEWRDARDGGTFEAVSPASGEEIGPVAQAGREDAAAAVSAASAAYPAWGRETAFGRAKKLHTIGEVCTRRREELAEALTLDQGKPLHESYDEVDELIAMWHAAAEDGLRLEGTIPPSNAPRKRVLLMRRPVGPTAAVTPWNWPYTMPAEIVAPALAAGNTVAWTPASTTAMCSGLLAECVAEADLPPGTFNFVTGPGSVVGDELVGHDQTAAVGFIGSTETGLTIARRAAGKRLLLEMGGNGPLVVLDDADLDAAVEAAITGCFLCAGQSCTAGERILAHRAIREAFVAKLAARTVAQIKLGDPFDAATRLGPLNNEGVAAKMDDHVADAAARGATVVTGGARDAGRPTSLYWPATILDDVAPDALAATEETFGPIAPVVEVDSLEHAIELTNASPYGLLAAIFTRDLQKGLRYADEARTGLVNINETTNYWENHLPFGGRAGTASGVGRVGGRYAMETLTELQTVVIG